MKNTTGRIFFIVIITALLAIACVVRLFDLQIVKGSDYEQTANQRLVRAYSIPAPRGEILDRNGKPIIENRMGYSVRVLKMDMSNDELNQVIYDTASLVASYDGKIDSTFPVVINENTDKLDFDFTIEKNGGTRKVDGVKVILKKPSEDSDSDTSDEKDEEELTKEARAELEKKKTEQIQSWKAENKLNNCNDANDVLNYYVNKYGVSDNFDQNAKLAICAVRYAMEKSDFSEKNPYTLARDIDMLAVQKIKEQRSKYNCMEVAIEPIRVYSQKKLASHILGRTGKIYAEEYAEMKNDGYGINDIIGKEGLEKALEKYLKGKDGYKSVEMNTGGGVSQILGSSDPVPGNYAKLTLDIDLQKETERVLKEEILSTVGAGGAGAAIAVDPKTGGVLSIASYPTYDLTTFDDDYDKLLKSKSKPLINRALSGTYSPGSTFKPLTAVSALESGIITPNSYITDKGKYTYFDSYQPTCLVYSSSGATHGTINVSEAIGVSCNYFFYDIGRRTGIEKIDEYAHKFGLGEHTGIELSESTGIVAGPEEREKAGGVWYPGDVLQTAIGQSDNLFTPAQLASYICTLINKGKRYSLHLVDEVVNYDTGEVVLKKGNEVLSDNPISDETYNAVRNGMRQVVTSGTANASFATCRYAVAGKTGTAEVPDGADNVLFVGFAPYDNPEIVVAVIIEHGEKSTFPSNVARSIIDTYMAIKSGKYGKTASTDSKN